MDQLITAERAAPSPILDKITALTLFRDLTPEVKSDRVRVTICKDSCGKVWCQSCFVQKGFSKNIAERIVSLKRRHTRTLSLTVDREKFNNGEESICKVQKDQNSRQFFKYQIPYKHFIKEFDDIGWFEPGGGFVIQFKSVDEFFDFHRLCYDVMDIIHKDNPAAGQF